MNLNFDTLRQQRDELYQDARSHPDSEADQMVQILLLTALRKQQAGEHDANFGDALLDERRGYRQARAKRIRERRQAQAAKGTQETPEDEVNREASEGEAEALSAKIRLEKVAQALENMKAAAESGKEMDAAAVYKRIAEIVGLNSPLVPIGQDANAAKTGFGV